VLKALKDEVKKVEDEVKKGEDETNKWANAVKRLLARDEFLDLWNHYNKERQDTRWIDAQSNLLLISKELVKHGLEHTTPHLQCYLQFRQPQSFKLV